MQKNILDIMSMPQKLDFLWIELTSKCNLKCIHCFDTYKSPSKKCFCTSKLGSADRINYLEWQKVLKDATDLECNNLQLIGGEPLLLEDEIYKVFRLSRGLGYKKIELFTNATLINKKTINHLDKNNVSLKIPLYSKKPEIHDRITGLWGSQKKIVENIKELRKAGIEIELKLLILKHNQNFVEETLDFFKELDCHYNEYSYVYPTKGTENYNIVSDKYLKNMHLNRPNFNKATLTSFYQRQEGHPCWDGKLGVTSNGDVVPCISARKEIIGNIKNNSIKKLIRRGKLDKYWRITKDKIEICKKCEYRYVCFDCRPIENSSDSTLLGRNKYCNYNPLKGEWEERKIKEVRKNNSVILVEGI